MTMAWQNYYALQKRGSKNKYRNNKTIVDGEEFDSIKESRRWRELKLMESAGMIHGLERQKKFVLIPAQREPDTVGKRGGKKKGKVIEHEASYYADFAYYDKDGNMVVEDVKSPATRTKDYVLKRKMMLYFHKIKIIEV